MELHPIQPQCAGQRGNYVRWPVHKDADRRHQQDEARRAEEAAHDRQVDDRADGAAERRCHQQRQPEVPPVVEDQLGEHRGAERADLAVGEVDDLRRPVHEHQPRRQDGVGQAGDGAAYHGAEQLAVVDVACR